MQNFDYKDIKPLDEQAMEDARQRLDSLSKPLGSLGRLEEYAVKLAGIRGYIGGSLVKKAVLVFAADNGLHCPDITPVPKAVTMLQTLNIARGVAGVSVLARQAGADVRVYNVGVELPINSPDVIDVCVMNGTEDMAAGPAMSRGQCERAIAIGYAAVADNPAYDVYGLGEMGICNTSTAAAVTAAFTGADPKVITGKGAGINDTHYQNKIAAIERALELNKPDPADPVDVLAKVGGLDIAAMAGAYLACAHYGVPVVIDGFISAAAALAAEKMAPACRPYMFASHKSKEPGYMSIAKAMNLDPPLDLDMRLGEGSGCPLMFNILEASLRVIEDMATFEEGNVDSDEFIDLRND